MLQRDAWADSSLREQGCLPHCRRRLVPDSPDTFVHPPRSTSMLTGTAAAQARLTSSSSHEHCAGTSCVGAFGISWNSSIPVAAWK